MLLNKFQHDHERQQCREEETCCNKEYWKCPFFVYCWEEGLTLPSAYDCPECNGGRQGSQSYKNPRFNDEPRRCERTPVHDRLGGRISMHDWLGGKAMLRDPTGGRVHALDRLERMADDRVQDDQPMHRYPEREPYTHHTSQPQWCPTGLTRHKRGVFRDYFRWK